MVILLLFVGGWFLYVDDKVSDIPSVQKPEIESETFIFEYATEYAIEKLSKIM